MEWMAQASGLVVVAAGHTGAATGAHCERRQPPVTMHTRSNVMALAINGSAAVAIHDTLPVTGS